MTPPAVLANDYFTSSSATTPPAATQVLQLGVISSQRAETTLGSPESAIDYDAGSATLLAARDVEEAASSTVAVDSPFGI
jgi:hypothetical protein